MGFLSGITVVFRCETRPSRMQRGELWASLTWVPHLVLLPSSCVSLANDEAGVEQCSLPLLLHSQSWGQNRNGRNSYMFLQRENRTSHDLPDPGIGKRFLAGNSILPGPALSPETIWNMRIIPFFFFFYCTNIYCVFTMSQPLCMESKCRHGTAAKGQEIWV